jgi:micrococcal nuclease
MLKTICIALGLCSTLSGPATVTDGDTIKVDGVSVRLWGLDCEEMNEPNGPAARKWMRFATQGAPIYCELTGARSYSRYVGRCYAGGRYGVDLAQWMVRVGACLDCAHYSGGKYRYAEPEGVRARLIQKPYC